METDSQVSHASSAAVSCVISGKPMGLHCLHSLSYTRDNSYYLFTEHLLGASMSPQRSFVRRKWHSPVLRWCLAYIKYSIIVT